jgi:hypothetical protein
LAQSMPIPSFKSTILAATRKERKKIAEGFKRKSLVGFDVWVQDASGECLSGLRSHPSMTVRYSCVELSGGVLVRPKGEVWPVGVGKWSKGSRDDPDRGREVERHSSRHHLQRQSRPQVRHAMHPSRSSM